MTLKEITIILEKIKRTSSLDERYSLISDYWDPIRSSFFNLTPSEREELKKIYPNELVDFGILGRAHYTAEERERRKQAAKNRPKYTPTEEILMQIFHENFGTDLHWLKSRKALSKLRKNGVNIMHSEGDSNIYEGHHYIRRSIDSITVYTFCFESGLPYFEIWLDNKQEDIFFYLQKAEEISEENIALNKNAIKFLISVQKSFASRTPDTVYLSSFKNWDESGMFLWTETSKDPWYLLSYTDRITSGFANIVSISEATRLNSAGNILNINSVARIEERNRMNGTSETTLELSKIRRGFDKAFEPEEKPMIKNRVNKDKTCDNK